MKSFIMACFLHEAINQQGQVFPTHALILLRLDRTSDRVAGVQETCKMSSGENLTTLKQTTTEKKVD
jgi:hypothetical protein